jgi:ribosomal-protein-alanine N-acetyltransferase
MRFTWAGPGEAAALAAAHAESFSAPWGASTFDELLAGPGTFALLAAAQGKPEGLNLCRVAAGEMEVLTLGVVRQARRRGLGQALMAAALEAGRSAGAEAAFLEVAVDNVAALGLYQGLGFSKAGLRPNYYDRGPEGRADAIVMRLDLNTARP